MQRQRGELVPIGESHRPGRAGEESPPALAPGAAPLHPRRSGEPVDRGQRSGPRSRVHGAAAGALCSLPRTNPGNRHQYKRVNGPYKLILIAGGDNRLPYGNLPRLILAWVCTEAVRTQSRELVLGRSFSGFMRKLGMQDDSGSPRGDRTRLRNQMKRLFNASVQLIYEDAQVDASASSFVADRTVFWWNERNPVPLDMNTLTALKRCSLGLDIYLWLVYRIFALRAPQHLTWRQVYRQFAAHPENAHTGAPRAEEDQAGLAGPELHHGSGRLDPASLDSRDPSGSPSTGKLGRKARFSRPFKRRPILQGARPAETRSWGFL